MIILIILLLEFTEYLSLDLTADDKINGFSDAQIKIKKIREKIILIILLLEFIEYPSLDLTADDKINGISATQIKTKRKIREKMENK